MLVETGNQSHFDSASCLFSPLLVDGSQVRVRCTRLPLQNDLIAGVSSTSASLLVGSDPFLSSSPPFVPILGPSRSPLVDDTSLVLNASLPLVAGTPILLPLVLAATLVNTEIETSPDAAFPLDDDISSIPLDPEIGTSPNDTFQ